MKILFLLFVYIISFGTAFGGQGVGHTHTHKMDKGSCGDFGKKLKICSKFACKMPDPAGSGEKITHRISGFNDNGTCKHTQTMPNGNTLECNYTQDVRFVIAKMFDMYPNAQPSKTEVEIVNTAFSTECVIHISSENIKNMNAKQGMGK